MSRYFGHVLIEFMDGTTARVGGNRSVVRDDQLIVKTESSYGDAKDIWFFPLANIKNYRWEGE